MTQSLSRVVPTRPTPNMLREAVRYWQSLPGQIPFADLDRGAEDTLIGKALFTWEAMLSAAPAPDPDTLSEAVGLLRTLFEQAVTYTGSSIVIPTESHGAALQLANHARLLIDLYDANTPDPTKGTPEVNHD